MNLSDGNDTLTVKGSISGGAKVDMGAGDDMVTVSADIDNSNVQLGDGINTLNVRNVVSGATVGMGTGYDTLVVTGNISGGSKVNLGEGVGQATIGGNIDGGNTTLTFGASNDILSVTGNVSGGATVNTGDGADTVTVTGQLTGNSVINLGAGNDTIKLGYFNDDSGSYINGGEGIDQLILNGVNRTATTNDLSISNIEVVDLAGSGSEYNISLADITLSGDTLNTIFINQSGTNNRIDLGDNGGTATNPNLGNNWSKSTSAVTTEDPLGNTHTYDVYVHMTNNAVDETLYIQQGITVI